MNAPQIHPRQAVRLHRRAVAGCLSLLLFAASASASPVDMGKAMLLVDDEQATAVAVQSGRWDDPATWADIDGDGAADLPEAGGKVWVPMPHEVELNIDTPRLKWLRVDGMFKPCGCTGATKVTLYVETFVTTMDSRLTADDSIDFDVVFTGDAPLDTATDPWAMGRGAILMGAVDLRGKAVTPYSLIAGAAKGATQIVTTAPTGWKVGDKLAIPGVGTTVDDDESAIAAISGQNITLAAPLKFNHGDKDRFGFPRPMLAANVSPRSISLRSEHPAVCRGHVMLMRSNTSVRQEFRNVSFHDLGRTDKSRVVTDPNGTGGGLDNPRGRYAIHWHLTNADRAGVPGLAQDCVVVGSPGWGFVSHGANVNFTRCVSYRVFGSHFTGEIGSEIGDWTDNVAIRATAPITANILNMDATRGNADWAWQGAGFWTQGGDILGRGNIATGCMVGHIALNEPFNSGTLKPFVWFESKNLRPEYPQPAAALIKPGTVPGRFENCRWFGCAMGGSFWGGDPIPGTRQLAADCSGESRLQGWLLVYSLRVTWERCRVVNSLSGYSGYGYSPNAGTPGMIVKDCEAYGWGVACDGPAGAIAGDPHLIRNLTYRGPLGIYLPTRLQDKDPRVLSIEGITRIPLTAGEIAAINALPSGLVKTNWGFQGGQQQDVLPMTHFVAVWRLRDNISLTVPATTEPRPNFGQFTTSIPFLTGPANETKLDGKHVYYAEEHPDFPLDRIKNLPPIFKGLTTRQLWEQHGMAFLGRLPADDATDLPGKIGMVSASPPKHLPELRVTKEWNSDSISRGSVQATSQKIGFVLRAQLSDGSFVQSAPTNLTDKAWNVVYVTVAGQKRGVMVWCDSGKVYPPAW